MRLTARSFDFAQDDKEKFVLIRPKRKSIRSVLDVNYCLCELRYIAMRSIARYSKAVNG